jgi:response regulator NasT
MPRLDGLGAAELIHQDQIAPVIILTAFSQVDLVRRARDAGVMAYLVKPFGRDDLAPAIEVAVSRWAEQRALEAEVADLAERLEVRKLIDRAKALLQAQGMSEADAFRHLQREAMDGRTTMGDIARRLLSAP